MGSLRTRLQLRFTSWPLIGLLLTLGVLCVTGCEEPQVVPAIRVADQSPRPLDEVVVKKAASPVAGLVVIRADADGAPGEVLGSAPVEEGVNELVGVSLSTEVEDGATLWAELVTDAGIEGRYEPDVDKLQVNARRDEPARASFKIALVTPGIDTAAQDVASFNQVVVQKVASVGPGWVVIHEDDAGAPGKAIGRARVASGATEGVPVPLERDVVNGEPLYAMLHVDAGQIGEFDDADVPVMGTDGEPLMSKFNPAITVNAWFGKVVGAFASVMFWTVPGIQMPLVVLWLFVGALFLTIRMGFVNFRMFGHAIQVVRGKYDDPDDEGEVSHFQALTSALSATVGLGNIAGVAIAVSLGGPGATFWMIVVGLLGMTAKFTECTLGQIYRRVNADGSVTGGAMMYLSQGLEKRNMKGLGKVLAVLFVVLCIGASFGGGNAFQINQSLGVLGSNVEFFAEHRYVYGLIMVAAVAVVIIGGIKRIGATAEKIVPLMCGIYLLAATYILIANASMIPMAFGTIFTEAFAPHAMYGGFIGVLVMGIKRAAFSNEAGIGSAAIAHAAAKTKYPVREGIVALLEPFIDTVVVCTMTALVIVITGAYNDPNYSDLIAGENGAALTSAAMGSVISWFPWVLMVATVMFAYSTMISWSYYGERCWTWLFGERSSILYKLLFLTFTFLGSIVTATNVLVLSDLMILGMAFPNILGLYLLHGEVRQHLKDYAGRLKAGELKTYDGKH